MEDIRTADPRPDVGVDDAALAAEEHQNMLGAFAMVASRTAGGSYRRSGGVVACLSRAPLPIFNQVAIADDDAGSDALVVAVEAMAAEDVPFLVNLRAGVDDRFAPTLERLGLHELGGFGLPGMALYPIEAQALPPAELEIRRVDDRAGLGEHLAINALASDAEPDVLDFLAGIGLERDPDVAVLLGLVDGSAVTTAMGYRTGRTLGVYSVATLAEARRRGYGAAMTREVLRAGADAGCEVAILQSSEMGLHVYEALGFRTVVRYRSFMPADREGDESAHG